ncbi:MAG: putative zinc-binding metallopeptidase [Xanthomonadales bacterium]|nr:putative zinc-binding metallopeptidase [Xanthomonadales bacterium]
MKRFQCVCGQRVYFENTSCLNCGRALGFDPTRLDMLALNDEGAGLLAADGVPFRYCANAAEFNNCNWLVSAESEKSRCLSCGMNRVIPALTKPENLELWTRVEEAKRRLIYSLLRYGLLFESGETRLNFRIMEDRRRNPDVLESFIATGHLEGTITINVVEADDAARHAIREQLQERYRTVLGHLRHEAGHFYFNVLAREDTLHECRTLFGDEGQDYDGALRQYYENGPLPDWPQQFVSAYASAHPAEDWAETFAHVLHIEDALETATAAGLLTDDTSDSESWLDRWVGLAVNLNEMTRSLGEPDAYPFVLTDAVRQKLEFVSRLVNRRA